MPANNTLLMHIDSGPILNILPQVLIFSTNYLLDIIFIFLIMNNQEALNFLNSYVSIREATEALMEKFEIPDEEIHSIRRKFGQLKSDRERFRKLNDLSTWESFHFHSLEVFQLKRKRTSTEPILFQAELPQDTRMPIDQLKNKGLKNRLKPILDLLYSMADLLNIDVKTLATYTLQLVSSEARDHQTSKSCKDLLDNGSFGFASKHLPIDKSLFLLDFLEIGKRKYTNMRKLCKEENIIFPPYNKIADFRANIILSSDIIEIKNTSNVTIGIGISYRAILRQTIIRLLETIPNHDDSKYPLSIKISDGLDGSGSHKIYNQFNGIPQFNTKNYILFAFKIISILDSSSNTIWCNDIPNSPFGVRPIVLLSQKENHENVKFLMDQMINPEVASLECEGLNIPQGSIKIKVLRTMFDGKMSSILSGAGGAHCQLCTANFKELKDLELVKSGFPINRNITSAIEIFSLVDTEEYLKLPSIERFGLTHEPISNIDIIPASPLHTYTCTFRWYMLLIYHIRSGTYKWSPTSRVIIESMKFARELLYEKTSLKIDQPCSEGGTTSTGNIARECFLNKNEFIYWVSTMIPENLKDHIRTLHTNLSVLLRIFNCSRAVQTDKLEILCKDTYQLILVHFPWANVTPSLHRLLAHSVELIRDCNDGYGLKNLSEEPVEASNKLIRKYRENLSRKMSFSVNAKDIFVRLLSQSDPGLATYRRCIRCKECGEIGHTCRFQCTSRQNNPRDQDILIRELFVENDNFENI